MYRVVWKQSAKELLSDLKSARKRYRESDHKRVTISPEWILDARLKAPPSKDLSVLRVYTRLAPSGGCKTVAERSIGRDNMWILKDELKSIVASAHPRSVWKKLPESLTARLVRFHLLNNCGNVGYMFDKDEVKIAEFKVKLDKFENTKRFYTFKGRFKSVGSKKEWGKTARIEGTLEGDIKIDTRALKLIAMRGYGSGVAYGGNDSVAKNRSYPIKFAIEKCTDKKLRRIPPFAYGLSPVFQPIYLNPRI